MIYAGSTKTWIYRIIPVHDRVSRAINLSRLSSCKQKQHSITTRPKVVYPNRIVHAFQNSIPSSNTSACDNRNEITFPGIS